MIRTIIFSLFSIIFLAANPVYAGGSLFPSPHSGKTSWFTNVAQSAWYALSGKKPETMTERVLRTANELPGKALESAHTLALYAKENPGKSSAAVIGTSGLMYGVKCAYDYYKRLSLADMPALDDGDEGDRELSSTRIIHREPFVSSPRVNTVHDDKRRAKIRLMKNPGVLANLSTTQTPQELARIIKRDEAQKIKNQETHAMSNAVPALSINFEGEPEIVENLTGKDKVLAAGRTGNDEAIINERIDHGKRVLTALLRGDQEVDSTPANAQAIIWALFAQAAEKNQEFSEGMFVVEDPHERLFEFLVKQGEAYKRISTHFKGKKEATKEYGVDVAYNNATFALPAEKGTILVGYLPNKKAVYIKPENYGLGTWYNWTMHALETVPSVLRKVSSVFGTNDQRGYRKEHIPAEVKATWAGAVGTLQRSGFITEDEARDAIALGNRDGICAMYHTLNTWRQQEGEEITAEAQAAIRSVDTMLQGYDNKRLRHGNEVIFTLRDLQAPLGLDNSVCDQGSSSRVNQQG